MNSNTKILNLLGLAFKAGKCATGEELTLKKVRSQEASIVFIAADASENTKKKISDKCHYYDIPYSERFTQAELSQAIGRKRTVVSIIDNGFAKKIRELLSN
ncbi:MAG: YlxQ-related RNA-binding protein [Pisciglobus halotolerans]|nr:YlxQ-related RNA-binding protein [Pisciglobus halotolerans]